MTEEANDKIIKGLTLAAEVTLDEINSISHEHSSKEDKRERIEKKFNEAEAYLEKAEEYSSTNHQINSSFELQVRRYDVMAGSKTNLIEGDFR